MISLNNKALEMTQTFLLFKKKKNKYLPEVQESFCKS